MDTTLANDKKYRRRIFSQLWMLGLQFLLGMTLNIIGEDTAGASHYFYVVILVIHILNAIGLAEGGLFIAIKRPTRLAWWGAVTVFATLCAGTVYVLTWVDIWSFLMAVGFLAASWQYIALFVIADRQLSAERNN